MSGYESGGYIYERPVVGHTHERVVTQDQAKHEIRTFSGQLKPLVWDWAPDKWRPYFENEHLGQESQTALDGLRVAIDQLSVGTGTPLALAFLKATRDNGYKALVGDLSDRRGLECQQRKNDRGVTTHAATLSVTLKSHGVIFGNQTGLIDIDSGIRPIHEAIPFDWLDYLPHIDGTTNYTIRHGGVTKIALGDTARLLLQEHGMQKLWEHYLTSGRSKV